MEQNILTWFITAAGGGLTWFVYTLSNRVTALETKDEQRQRDSSKIDQILAEIMDVKLKINSIEAHINQDRIEKESLKSEIHSIRSEVEALIRSNVR